MREYTKAIEAIQHAAEKDTNNEHMKDIQAQMIKCNEALSAQRAGESDEQALERAMRDPEIAVRIRISPAPFPNLCNLRYLHLRLSIIIVIYPRAPHLHRFASFLCRFLETVYSILMISFAQKIMGDPVMQSILQQAQTDPKALQDHMRNPAVRDNIMKLVNAGIIKTR